MKISKTLIASSLLMAACQPQNLSTTKDAWNAANNPVIMMAVKNEFETKFGNLPLAGRPSKMPWSDHYWPTYHGGITYRWADSKSKQLDKAVRESTDREFAGQLDNNEALQKLRSEVLGYQPYTKDQLLALSESDRNKLIASLSPAEKLDIYRSAFDYPTVKSERERTAILATLRTLPQESGEATLPNPNFEEGKKIPTWFGICHSWAPATILFDEPGPLTLESKDGFKVAMAGSDIKALLSHVLDVDSSQQRTSPFMAERCNNDTGAGTKEKLTEIYRGLTLGDKESVNKQIELLLDLSGLDFPTKLAAASHMLNHLPTQEEAKLNFQKLFERMQNRLSAGSSVRKKLAIAYVESLKNFAKAGKPDTLDIEEGLKKLLGSIDIAACNDTNAGAFHLVVANMMGVQQKSFGVDVTRDAEVWNQAAASYSSRVLKTFSGSDLSPEAAPGTVKEHLIETEFLYTTEEMPAVSRFGDNKSLRKHHVAAGDVYQEGNRKYKAYRYRIELDKMDRIIGGSWVSEERPDFIWGTGNFVWSSEFSDIEDIYYQSI